MKRYEFEKAVYASALDHGAKQVLVYMAFRKNWNKGTKSWPSIETVARDTALSRSTVQRRLSLLRELGWLVTDGKTRGHGVIVYDLQVGRSDPKQVHGDAAVVLPDLAGASEGLTEQVREQDKEEVLEEVTTSAVAPVVEELFPPKRMPDSNPDTSPLGEPEAPRPESWEEARAERDHLEFKAWYERSECARKRQALTPAAGDDEW